MFIEKCDICKKVIKNRDDRINVRVTRPYVDVALCEKCNRPILTFLRRQKLVVTKSNP